MKGLSNIRSLGRYKNLVTGKCFNVKKGRNKERSTDHIFYLYRGKKIIIQDNEFYGGNYEKMQPSKILP